MSSLKLKPRCLNCFDRKKIKSSLFFVKYVCDANTRIVTNATHMGRILVMKRGPKESSFKDNVYQSTIYKE